MDNKYLQHHGILGQKWGKQNGPPYPLDAEDHSASERKAGWRKSLNGDPNSTKNRLRNVDPELAKNKQTKRAAYDYHNLSDLAYSAKYHTTKAAFRRRYIRSKGNTYGMGLRKAAIATYINLKLPAPDIHNNGKYVQMGKAQAASILAMDIAYSEAAARIGYNRAETRYNAEKEYEKNHSN